MKFTVKRFFSDIGAVAAIEFALVLPILILLFAGTIEVTRYVLANQKIDKAANSLSDYISQQPNPQNVNMDQLNETFKELMKPFSSDQTQFIVSSIYHNDAATNPNQPLYVRWQDDRGGLSFASKVGSVGSTVTGGAENIKIDLGERLVAVEVYYEHQNLIDNVGKISSALDYEKGDPLYKVAFFRQRQIQVPDKPGQSRTEPPVSCCGYYCKSGNNITVLPDCACNINATKCVNQKTLDAIRDYYNSQTPKDTATIAALDKCTNVCNTKPNNNNNNNTNTVPYCERPGNDKKCRCGYEPACSAKGEATGNKAK